MSFKSGKLKVGEADPLMGLPILTRDEVFYLLNIIRKSDFKGEEMEELFKLTLKLQRMFVDLNKWQDK